MITETTPQIILIIDDDPDARMILSRLLGREGVKVLEAESVKEGIEQAEKSPPQLVLLDLHMPEEDGLSFLRRRHAIPVLAPVPFIIISALSDSDSIHQAIALGAVDYIIKPYRSQILAAKIKKAFKEKTFGTHEFNPASLPVAKIKVRGEIRLISEACLTLQSPAKIAAETKIEIDGAYLKKLGMDQPSFQTLANPPLYTGEVREYLSQVNFVGLTEINRQKISKLMGNKP